MLNDIQIEKYKMLISTMPEDKVKKALKMLKEAMNEGNDASKALPKVNKFVMQNANVYIVKDQNEIKDKDLTGYGAVMFDCDVKGVTDFSNCPKKMIFNKCVYIESVDEFFYSEKIRGSIDNYNIKKLPDLSESVVIGHFVCRNCDNLTSLEGAPKYVGGNFDCSKCNNLKNIRGSTKIYW